MLRVTIIALSAVLTGFIVGYVHGFTNGWNIGKRDGVEAVISEVERQAGNHR